MVNAAVNILFGAEMSLADDGTGQLLHFHAFFSSVGGFFGGQIKRKET